MSEGQTPEVDPIALPIALLALKTGYGYLPLDQDEESVKKGQRQKGVLPGMNTLKPVGRFSGRL